MKLTTKLAPPPYYICFIILLIVFSCKKHSIDWIESLPKPWTLTETDISEILPEFHSRFPDFHDRLKAFALWQVGKPYEIFKLGEEKEPDTDPIIRLDVSDCTVHVLTSLVFVQSESWQDAREKMIHLHYKDHQPDFTTRWHFTSDRILSHPGTVDMTKTLLPVETLNSATVTLNQKENGEELLELDWKREIETSYIPNDQINEKLMKKLPNVCGVAFVKKSYFKSGIVIAHEGMIIDNQFLIHASSTTKETSKIDFLIYYFSKPDGIFDGVMVYEFRPMDSKLINNET
jgi:hypothetical protein